MSLPFEESVVAMHAQVLEPVRAPETLDVVTDTRTIAPGQTFLALPGERFDGHDFVAEAVRRGAAAVIVSDRRMRAETVATIVVEDTQRAYMTLAAAARERYTGRVIAVTGSTGKTTTKSFLQQLLAVKYNWHVAASPENENNEIGMSKFLLAQADAKNEVLVVEMGARHPGDIAPLVSVARPHVGVLTNIGDAHLEIMGSREQLVRTKWELFGDGARAILNWNDEASRECSPALASAPVWFGAADALPASRNLEQTYYFVAPDRLMMANGSNVVDRAIDVRVPGAHNRANLAAAIAGACELGVALEAAAEAIPALTLPSGRFERLTLSNGLHVIYDAYNANVAGMIAALDAFAEEKAARRIAVLASMAELGDRAPQMHEQVGAHAARANIDVLLVGGTYADSLARGARDAGLAGDRIVRFDSNPEAAAWLRERAATGDLVLLKGSRLYRLEEIVEGLRT
jgi:UDP-N-acetylmuramoyl-tripeptide--D-alanyl-D-alanine ligase